MNLRIMIRKLLKCRPNETVNDAIYRHELNVQKKIYKKKITIDGLKNILEDVGIKKGDNIMIHSSYRAFFNYVGTPKDVISTIIDIIGKDGTLVMPCYGPDRYNFDVDNDKSSAGVLSEVFRKYDGVSRSRGSHFACAAYGKNSYEIIKEHELSKYGFDEYSPYYKFVNLDNSKIIMMGLGKKSVKLSLYHLPEMILRNNIEFYNKLFKKTYASVVMYREGNKLIKKVNNGMLLRESTIPNKKNIKKIYKQKFVTYGKISNLDIVIIDAKSALDYLINESKKGNYMIKKHK